MLYQNSQTVTAYTLGFTSPNAEVMELIYHLQTETAAATDWAIQASGGILAFLALATLIGSFLRKL